MTAPMREYSNQKKEKVDFENHPVHFKVKTKSTTNQNISLHKMRLSNHLTLLAERTPLTHNVGHLNGHLKTFYKLLNQFNASIAKYKNYVTKSGCLCRSTLLLFKRICHLQCRNWFRYILIIHLTAMNSTIKFASAEDVNQYYNANQVDDHLDDFETYDDFVGYNSGNTDNPDWFIVFILSLLFGFCFTFCGSIIAYFSLKEDRLMRDYKNFGQIAQGDIMSAESVRNHGMWFSSSHKLNEYLVYVEYTHLISDNYPIRVRKKLRVQESDFRKRDIPMSALNIDTSEIVDENLSRVDFSYQQARMSSKKNDHRISCRNSFGDESASGPIIGLNIHRSDHFGIFGTYVIDVMVLPEFPLSAYPRNSVLRNCGVKYRFMTFALIFFELLLAAISAIFAIQTIKNLEDGRDRDIAWYGIGFFTLLLILQVPFIVIFFNSMMEQTLRDEYLTTGEIVPSNFDDSTISSSSDVFLMMSRSMSVGVTSFDTAT